MSNIVIKCASQTTKPWFPGTGHSTKIRPYKDIPSLQKDLFFAIWKTFFYATYWLSKLERKWWSNSILVTCISITINWWLWAHIHDPKMVWSPLIATWRVHHLLQTVTPQFTALRQKCNCPFAKYCCSALWLWNVAHKWTLKELTTMELRTSWQSERTHGLNQRNSKAFYWNYNFQGPKRTLGTLQTYIHPEDVDELGYGPDGGEPAVGKHLPYGRLRLTVQLVCNAHTHVIITIIMET